MKKLLLVLLVLGTVVLSSCANTGVSSVSSSADTEAVSGESADAGSVAFVYPQTHWILNPDVQDLVDEADLVFTGQISDISFKMLDTMTGLPPTEETDEINCFMVTMYDVDIITAYKGNPTKSMQVKIWSGIKGYREEEQKEIAKDRGIKYIQILAELPKMRIGKTFLFAVMKGEDCTAFISNPYQCIYDLHDPFIKRGFYEQDKYYLGKKDESGSPIISAKDVIMTFGEDKWDAFWDQWRKDNENWETWLDKATVEKALAEDVNDESYDEKAASASSS